MAVLEDPIAPPAVATPPRARFKSRIAGKLREQTRFSLATMLEWIAAYTLGFAAAWNRADNELLSGACLGAIGAGLVVRIAFRSEGRRISHYLVFALTVALGGYMGARLLCGPRAREAAPVLQQLESQIRAVKNEQAGLGAAITAEVAQRKKDLYAASVKSLQTYFAAATDQQHLEDRIDEGVAFEWNGPRIKNGALNYSDQLDVRAAALVRLEVERFKQFELDRGSYYGRKKIELERRIAVLSTWLCQIKQQAESLDVHIVKIPDTPDGWTPLLVPVDRRMQLEVYCGLDDIDLQRLKTRIQDLTGLECVFSERLEAKRLTISTTLDLSGPPMIADRWLHFICGSFDMNFEIRSGKLYFDLNER